MDFKKELALSKGCYVRWSREKSFIFPDYRDVSGSYVSRKRLERAKKIVIVILLKCDQIIYRAFQEFCRKKYKGCNKFVRLDISSRAGT